MPGLGKVAWEGVSEDLVRWLGVGVGGEWAGRQEEVFFFVFIFQSYPVFRKKMGSRKDKQRRVHLERCVLLLHH